MKEANYSEQEHGKLSTNQNPFPTPKRKRNDRSKRFSDDQVKLLESMFNREAKLEPRNKLQLAKDLGLQPRQVSIWFQNKRARWKSKKLEQEYRVLKANFDALHQQFESLKKENESLLEQLHTLNSLLENSHRSQNSSKESNESILNTVPANRDENIELRRNSERTMNVDVDRAGIDENIGQKEETEFDIKEETEFDILTEQGESSSASRKQWCNLLSSGLLDESCCPSSWWDF